MRQSMISKSFVKFLSKNENGEILSLYKTLTGRFLVRAENLKNGTYGIQKLFESDTDAESFCRGFEYPKVASFKEAV